MTASPWPGFFDPADPILWANGSDVDWTRGDWIESSATLTALGMRNPWLVTNRKVAEAEIRAHPQEVTAIAGALLSWRVCTASQINAGLTSTPTPPFTRTSPNLYGAMCRLGIINIGFSPTERLTQTMVDQTWISMGNDAKLVRRGLAFAAPGPWIAKALTPGRLSAMRSHARHNTYAAHAGLALVHDERIRLTGGDGWGAFRLIDPQATAEAGLNLISSTDLVALTQDNVLAGIEVQAHSNRMEQKIENWTRLLAASPMRRRGLLCIWLLIPNPRGQYPAAQTIFDRIASSDQAMAGDPPVVDRIGIARWDEWFDHGRPTEALGRYTDPLGRTGSIFDPKWKPVTPDIADPGRVGEWGWQVMRDQIRRHWGWDPSGWSMPEAYKGGFHGFTTGGPQ